MLCCFIVWQMMKEANKTGVFRKCKHQAASNHTGRVRWISMLRVERSQERCRKHDSNDSSASSPTRGSVPTWEWEASLIGHTHAQRRKKSSINHTNTNMCPREGTAPWQATSERVGAQAMCQGRVATYLPTTQSKMDSKRATFISACSCSLISDSGSGRTSCENASDGEQRGRKVR